MTDRCCELNLIRTGISCLLWFAKLVLKFGISGFVYLLLSYLLLSFLHNDIFCHVGIAVGGAEAYLAVLWATVVEQEVIILPALLLTVLQFQTIQGHVLPGTKFDLRKGDQFREAEAHLVLGQGRCRGPGLAPQILPLPRVRARTCQGHLPLLAVRKGWFHMETPRLILLGNSRERPITMLSLFCFASNW